jgi:TFIIF-interacting CTD phosphatase-like protein
MDRLDPRGLCSSRLFRQHCTVMNNSFVKDLRKLDRDLKDIIILDVNVNLILE